MPRCGGQGHSPFVPTESPAHLSLGAQGQAGPRRLLQSPPATSAGVLWATADPNTPPGTQHIPNTRLTQGATGPQGLAQDGVCRNWGSKLASHRLPHRPLLPSGNPMADPVPVSPGHLE